MLVLCSVVSATAVQQLDSNLLYAQMTTTSGVEPSRRPSPRTRDCSTVLRFGLLFVVLSALIIIFHHLFILLKDDTVKRTRITVQRAGQQGGTNLYCLVNRGTGV